MADFNFYINRQGIQGRKGDKGDTGFSPTISVGTDTVNEYKLVIANEANSFETPNLRGNINVLDNGGTYLRYDAETQQISAQSLDSATSTTVGGVLMSTASDIETMGDNTVITPANLADALPVYLQGEGAVTITQDEVTSKTKINVDLSSVDELKFRVSAAEADIVGIQTDIAGIDADISTLNNVTANHTTSISVINNNITDLNNNKVAKTDFATTETAGIVKVDGTTITVDENGVITSVYGGSTGDVTSDGDNNFNGINSFNDYTYFNGNALFYKPIYANCYPDPIYYDNQTWSWSPAANTQFVMGKGLINLSSKSVTLETPEGAIGKAPLKNVTLTSSGDLILKANNNTIAGNISMSSIPRIKDGDGNVMLSQGNVTAGENITIDKTDAGIKINSTASGGAAIDDNNISTTTVYSSDKTVNLATNLVDNAMITLNQTKQDTLVSGTNIKTINGQSILGEGDITISGGGGTGDVPIATTTTAGKVKPDGTTITVTEDGTISANSSYTLPTASTSQLGGVKVDGTSVTIDSNGVISAAGGEAPTNMVTTNTAQTITGKKVFSNDDNHDVIEFEYTGATSRPKGFIGMNTNIAGGLISLGVDYNSRYGANMITVGSNISNGSESSMRGIRFSPNADGLIDCHLVMGAINYASSIGFLNSSGTITLNPRAGGHLDIGSNSLTFTNSDGTSHDLLASGAPIDDTTASDTTTYSSNKITNLTSDLISNAADGQWVGVNLTLFAEKTWGVGSNEVTYSLEDIIPNDGYNYEVLVASDGNTGATAGSQISCEIKSSLATSGGLILYRGQTRASSSVSCGGCSIVPIGSDHTVTFVMSVGTSDTSTTYGYIKAYRRLGKNQ